MNTQAQTDTKSPSDTHHSTKYSCNKLSWPLLVPKLPIIWHHTTIYTNRLLSHRPCYITVETHNFVKLVAQTLLPHYLRRHSSYWRLLVHQIKLHPGVCRATWFLPHHPITILLTHVHTPVSDCYHRPRKHSILKHCDIGLLTHPTLFQTLPRRVIRPLILVDPQPPTPPLNTSTYVPATLSTHNVDHISDQTDPVITVHTYIQTLHSYHTDPGCIPSAPHQARQGARVLSSAWLIILFSTSLILLTHPRAHQSSTK